MLDYMSQETLGKMIGDGVVCFYLRSEQRLWIKGEIPGHTQRVEDIHIDRDDDTILIDVIPSGPACHTDSQGCFNTGVPLSARTLAQAVQDSVQSNNEKSYTKCSLTEGIEKITKKYGEEAFEIVIETVKDDKKVFVSEVADESYYLFVLMHALGVDFSEIEAELARRHHKRNNLEGERQNTRQW